MCPSKLKFGTQGLGLYFCAVVSCPLFRVVKKRYRVYKRCMRLSRTLERANSVEPFCERKAVGRGKRSKVTKASRWLYSFPQNKMILKAFAISATFWSCLEIFLSKASLIHLFICLNSPGPGCCRVGQERP